MNALFILIQSLSFALVAFATTATFTNPTEGGSSEDPSQNEVYTVGDTINVTWTTDAAAVNLVIWQDSTDSVDASIGQLQYLKDSQTITQSWYLWNIETNGTPSFDLTKSNIFAFSLYIPGDGNPLAGSSWFNLTNSTVNAKGQIISTSSATTSPTSQTSSPSSTASSASRTTSSSSSSSSAAAPASSGLTASDKTAIGIGVGIGLPLLAAALAVVFLLLRRKGNVRNDVPMPGVEARESYAKVELDGNAIRSKHSTTYELPGQTSPAHELANYRYGG